MFFKKLLNKKSKNIHEDSLKERKFLDFEKFIYIKNVYNRDANILFLIYKRFRNENNNF